MFLYQVTFRLPRNQRNARAVPMDQNYFAAAEAGYPAPAGAQFVVAQNFEAASRWTAGRGDVVSITFVREVSVAPILQATEPVAEAPAVEAA